MFKKRYSCRFFNNGACNNGHDCLFQHVPKDSHEPRCGTVPCKYHFTGFCKKGRNCPFSHNGEQQITSKAVHVGGRQSSSLRGVQRSDVLNFEWEVVLRKVSDKVSEQRHNHETYLICDGPCGKRFSVKVMFLVSFYEKEPIETGKKLYDDIKAGDILCGVKLCFTCLQELQIYSSGRISETFHSLGLLRSREVRRGGCGLAVVADEKESVSRLSATKAGGGGGAVVSPPDGQMCCVCLDEKATYAIIPCGHLCLCDKCVTEISTQGCPICRGRKDSTLRIWN